MKIVKIILIIVGILVLSTLVHTAIEMVAGPGIFTIISDFFFIGLLVFILFRKKKSKEEA